MPIGFFKPSTFTDRTTQTFAVPRCNLCKLYQGCQSPKMEPTGKGLRKILIIGEAPGKNEDLKGGQFCGLAGEKLERELAAAGIDMRRDCWLTNSIICRPPKNRTPDDKELSWCRPNLIKTIATLNPDIIVPVGAKAVKQVLAGLWREDVGPIERWAGWRIPCRPLNAWICPTWHPSYLLQTKDPALELWWSKHLKAISKLERKPYGDQGPRDLEEGIEKIMDPDHAALRIRGMMVLGDFMAAFDYETTMLKPDSPQARIVCCSISWGNKTIAYPWTGAAIEATRDFLLSPAPKIASNMKFEDRWTRRQLKIKVNNWHWDTMLAAHVLDNRRGITGLKFQAFVRLGFPVYDEKVKPYLQADGSNEMNRIKDVNLDQLLHYCALDSKLEFMVAEQQMKEMGYEQVASSL